MKQVTVYSSNRCSTCQMVKGYLALKGVPYVEKNVSVDQEARRELLALGFDYTPVTVIGVRVIEGFDATVLDSALREKYAE